jgi:hypothetical protein
VKTCGEIGWIATAKGHKQNILPVRHQEYLGMDVMAFRDEEKEWKFPVAVFELENQKQRAAYSLWKVLNVQTDLRIVFCYQSNTGEGSGLIRFLKEEVVRSMEIEKRVALIGETLVVVGNKGESEIFPQGFFKWWQLDINTGSFGLM